MTTNQTSPNNMRPTVTLIGNRNAGKSSLLNALIKQNVSITSDTPGTTTDAVMKIYELIPYGPITLYDTAGLDDIGELGNKRIKATQNIINRTDIIIYVIGKEDINKLDTVLSELDFDGTPFIPVINFADTICCNEKLNQIINKHNAILTSAKTGLGIEELKTRLLETLSLKKQDKRLLENLVKPNDTVVMVTPIDIAAPKGRLILPQVQTLREILDINATAIVTKENTLKESLSSLKNAPNLIITDSQAVKEVAQIVPDNIPLTTFSMLFARAKGDIKQLYDGINAINNLKPNARILIAEGCSHHITCNDIGRVKIPLLLKKHTGLELNIDFASGLDFSENVTDYDLIIHCGGCMLNQKEISRRLKLCSQHNVPITNYGMVISLAQGVLNRTIAPLL